MMLTSIDDNILARFIFMVSLDQTFYYAPERKFGQVVLFCRVPFPLVVTSLD